MIYFVSWINFQGILTTYSLKPLYIVSWVLIKKEKKRNTRHLFCNFDCDFAFTLLFISVSIGVADDDVCVLLLDKNNNCDTGRALK